SKGTGACCASGRSADSDGAGPLRGAVSLMALFHRRDAPPAAALANLDHDERVVSWADTADGQVVLATPRGLWWPDGGGYRLIGWQYVSKAVWRERILAVTQADIVD